MLTGWPNDEATPSYAHVMNSDSKTLFDAISADAQAVADGLLAAGFINAGTPDDIVPVIDAFQEAGVDQLIIHMQMGNVPHEHIMESIEVLGTEVLPTYQ